MGLAYSLDAEAFNSLDDSIKSLYKQSGDGYRLDIDNDPTVDLQDHVEKLKTAKQHEVDNYNKLRTEHEEKLKELESIQAESDKKVTNVKQSAQDQISKAQEELESQINILKTQLHAKTVKEKANELSQDFTSPNLVSAHIEKRLKLGADGNIQVLDNSGQPTALTLDDFRSELHQDADLKPLLIASKGSGSGASGNTNSGAEVDLSKMNGTQLAQYAKESPENQAAVQKHIQNRNS